MTYNSNTGLNNANAEKDYLARRKGEVGEYVINLASLPKDHKCLDDLMFSVGDRTTQIDHLVVSPYGIFVIETKNYKGWLFGNDNCKHWTQTFGKNAKYKLQNPIWQNKYHIKAVKSILKDYEDVKYYSIISISRNAVLKVRPKSKDGSYYVVFNNEVADIIRSKRIGKCLTEEQVNAVIEKLRTANITDPQAREAHNKAGRES